MVDAGFALGVERVLLKHRVPTVDQEDNCVLLIVKLFRLLFVHSSKEKVVRVVVLVLIFFLDQRVEEIFKVHCG